MLEEWAFPCGDLWHQRHIDGLFDPVGYLDRLQRAVLEARAAALGFPALFCAVPVDRAQPLLDALGSVACTFAPATVYGAGLAKGRAWHLNTSEI